MPTRNSSRLKARWTKMPDKFFETLTFGEIKVGERFIVFPIPGDNSGHGGFLGAHHIFIKIQPSVTKTESGLPYGIPHGRAMCISRLTQDDLPHSMSVILLE